MKTVYIKRHGSDAGKWIYNGYKHAWEYIGYTTELYDTIEELDGFGDDSYVMAVDCDFKKQKDVDIVSKFKKCFLFVQPNSFPMPWGNHPNFYTLCPDHIIGLLNKRANVHKWTFSHSHEHHYAWNEVATVPLAFDSISYKKSTDSRYAYDVCYIGGIANNGFNEKYKIMINHLGAFKGTGLKCGFFINKGLSHEQENLIIANSKVCINVHDAYQRVLGLDTNERTFKTLGLNGALVSDNVNCLSTLFPGLKMADSPDHMVHLVREMLQSDLTISKKRNIENILNNHTYIARVKSMEMW